MIARLWHGVTLAEKSTEYLAFLQARAVPDYRSTPGNVSVEILHRSAGYVTHFLIVTHWDSAEAIASKRVTYDFARLMEGATEVKCSEFADEIIKHL